MIYIDMDGVVADFDQGIVDVFGEAYSNKNADKFWKSVCVEAEVFRKMPPIQEGVEMVNEIRGEHPICFLTSTGGLPHHIDIAKQKLDWLHKHDMGQHPVAFCMNTQGKAQYAHPGAILIDDRVKVCTTWSVAGGTPIQFTREKTDSVLSHLLFLMNERAA